MSHEGTSGSCCGSSGSACGDGQGEFTPTDDKPLHLTDGAVAAVKNAITQEGQPGDGLRVSVVGGGCSGLQYNLDFEREERMGDVVLNFNGVQIYVDSVSAGYLKGTVIDFVSGLNGTGFKFNNPNARRTCGCGSSFS